MSKQPAQIEEKACRMARHFCVGFARRLLQFAHLLLFPKRILKNTISKQQSESHLCTLRTLWNRAESCAMKVVWFFFHGIHFCRINVQPQHCSHLQQNSGGWARSKDVAWVLFLVPMSGLMESRWTTSLSKPKPEAQEGQKRCKHLKWCYASLHKITLRLSKDWRCTTS